MKRNLKITTLALFGIISIGFVRIASAQSNGGALGSFQSLVNIIGSFIGKYIIPALFAAALLYFLWNIIQFILHMDNEKEREEFKKYSINGIIALFIMLSIWGIFGIFSTLLFNKPPGVPQFPTNSAGSTTSL